MWDNENSVLVRLIYSKFSQASFYKQEYFLHKTFVCKNAFSGKVYNLYAKHT